MSLLLSDNDIKRELIKGENIMIYPLHIRNIKGSSINLTASKYAWKVSDGETAIKEDKIIIPPHDTVCIYTQESIWVSRRISGTYHSKVSQVSSGLGHIATTLDPQWYGLSLIAVPNHSSQPIEVKVGSTFVSVMFNYLKTAATKGKNENAASRPDISTGFKLTGDEKSYLQEDWHRSYEGIKTAMQASESYKDLVRDKKKFRQGMGEFFKHPLVYGLIIAITAALINFSLK